MRIWWLLPQSAVLSSRTLQLETLSFLQLPLHQAANMPLTLPLEVWRAQQHAGFPTFPLSRPGLESLCGPFAVEDFALIMLG